MVRNCAPENLEIPGLVLADHPGMTLRWKANARQKAKREENNQRLTA
jgi:hypothetical protein